MEIRAAYLPEEIEAVRSFLQENELSFDADINYTLYAQEKNRMIGTISVSNAIIKAFAVDKDYRGEAVASALISEMIRFLANKKIYSYQVYTKPINRKFFEAMNFREIITTDMVSLLESKHRNISEVLKKLKEEYQVEGIDTGALVMNCNPFTLGHQYVISEASKRHQEIIVFVLEEDKSFFSYSDRMRLVKLGTAEIKNVKVLPSTSYLVSALTFPTYFLKQDTDAVMVQAKADAMIFEKYFMPIFGIKMRYLGTETDLVTAKYNRVLKEVLKDKVTEIKRLDIEGETISASLVRKYFKTKEFDKIARLVPKTTLEFLKQHE